MITLRKKTNYALRLSVLVSVVSLLSLPLLVSAADAFVPLTGIPGVTDQKDFGDFLNGAFKIGLAIAATLAVVMITIGGLEYMTTDSVNNKTEGREKIQNAVVGLLIALLIWLILFTINPNLLNLDLVIGGDSRVPTDYESDAYGVEPTVNLRGGTVLDYEGDAYRKEPLVGPF
ncbi:hypothetical protein HQ403_00955 [Candidatus Kaiserbacteria bacterium]|nr:hypothetical protein [Candidatus Kaiserbacteria bacterium]